MNMNVRFKYAITVIRSVENRLVQAKLNRKDLYETFPFLPEKLIYLNFL